MPCGGASQLLWVYGEFEDQACRDRFIAGLVDETLQEKLNANGQTNRETLWNSVLWLK